MSQRFRKKPVVVEAWQWVTHDDGLSPIPPAPSALLRQVRRWPWSRPRWELRTLEGWYKLTPNDWLICGVKGEWYPCKPDVFAMTYEPETP